MGAAHQHDDLEINLVADGGTMLYLFGGVPVEVGPGSVAAFWAAVPHQLVGNSATRVHWLYVPFETFLSWGLPDALTGRLLSGTPLVSPPSAAAETDPVNFCQWAADLACSTPERQRIAMLEIEARVRRLALASLAEPMRQYSGSDAALRQVVAMVRHIAEYFREPLTVAHIAAAAQVHPNYAMAQFRKVVRTAPPADHHRSPDRPRGIGIGIRLGRPVLHGVHDRMRYTAGRVPSQAPEQQVVPPGPGPCR